MQKLGQTNWVVWALATFHGNGYVREQALKNLIDLEENIAIPFLFLRLLDWVEPIQKLAAFELIKRLKIKNTAAIYNQLSFWLKIKSFCSLSLEIKNEIDNYFKSNAVIQACLLKKFEIMNLEEKRSIFPYLIEKMPDEQYEFFLNCFQNTDLKIKMLALKHYKRFVFTPIIANRFYKFMRLSSFMPIRREALLLAVEWKIQEPEKLWKESLLDSHASIQELAQFYLKQMEKSEDVKSIYRVEICKKTHTTKQLRAAILGLGEVGTKEDISLIVRFLTHSLVSLVQASLYSLYKLGAEDELQLCPPNLLKKSFTKLSRKIYKILLKRYFNKK